MDEYPWKQWRSDPEYPWNKWRADDEPSTRQNVASDSTYSGDLTPFPPDTTSSGSDSSS